MRIYTAIASTLAVILAGFALMISLTHSGPIGPRGIEGPRGTIGRTAVEPHLGFCFNEMMDPTGSFVTGILAESQWLTDGVSSCPSGQFVSVIPQTTGNTTTAGNG